MTILVTYFQGLPASFTSPQEAYKHVVGLPDQTAAAVIRCDVDDEFHVVKHLFDDNVRKVQHRANQLAGSGFITWAVMGIFADGGGGWRLLLNKTALSMDPALAAAQAQDGAKKLILTGKS